MPLDLLPRTLWRMPAVWDDEDEGLFSTYSSASGVSISEDEKNVYVSVAVPGVEEKDIDITFDKGVLWVKGEADKEEKKDRKYYRRSTSSFSYRVSVPGDLDQNAEPEADYKNGVMHVVFPKSPKSQPKKISIKSK